MIFLAFFFDFSLLRQLKFLKKFIFLIFYVWYLGIQFLNFLNNCLGCFIFLNLNERIFYLLVVREYHFIKLFSDANYYWVNWKIQVIILKLWLFILFLSNHSNIIILMNYFLIVYLIENNLRYIWLTLLWVYLYLWIINWLL